jgi:predicted nicotinamide N-methyase
MLIPKPCAERNITLNSANIQKTARLIPAQLQWGEPLPIGVPRHPDILLAADCCYIEASFPLLLSTMKLLIGKDTICFFCYKRRRRADKDMIGLLMKEFAVVEIEGEWQRERMFVFEISRK